MFRLDVSLGDPGYPKWPTKNVRKATPQDLWLVIIWPLQSSFYWISLPLLYHIKFAILSHNHCIIVEIIDYHILFGWWFRTFFSPYIGNNHPNWLIFFRGVQTTNQLYIFIYTCSIWTKASPKLLLVQFPPLNKSICFSCEQTDRELPPPQVSIPRAWAIVTATCHQRGCCTLTPLQIGCCIFLVHASAWLWPCGARKIFSRF